MKRRPSHTPEFRDIEQILRQILEPAVYADYSLRIREMAVLKRLRKTYPDIAFWLSVKPVIPLGSLLYLYGPGKDALAAEWKAYQLNIAIGEAEKEYQLERDIKRLENAIADNQL